MILDFRCIDTTPGAAGCHAFLAPPADFVGDALAYRCWLQDSWKSHPGIRQYLQVASTTRSGPAQLAPQIIGPYADVLADVLAALRNRKVIDSESRPAAAA